MIWIYNVQNEKKKEHTNQKTNTLSHQNQVSRWSDGDSQDKTEKWQ